MELVLKIPGEHFQDEHGEWVNLNINEFSNFAKKHYLKIQYMEKDLRTEVNKRFSERVVFYL